MGSKSLDSHLEQLRLFLCLHGHPRGPGFMAKRRALRGSIPPATVQNLASESAYLLGNCRSHPGLWVLSQIPRTRTARLGARNTPGPSQAPGATDAAQSALSF